jgi:hypothetical protein
MYVQGDVGNLHPLIIVRLIIEEQEEKIYIIILHTFAVILSLKQVILWNLNFCYYYHYHIRKTMKASAFKVSNKNSLSDMTRKTFTEI